MDSATAPLKPILLIAFSYPPENTIGALRPARLARDLPRHGYVAHVITASRQPSDESPTIHFVPYTRTAIEGLAARVLPLGDENLSWTAPCIKTAAEVITKGSIGTVVSTFPPLGVHLAALELKRRYGLKWIADFRDPLRGSFGRRELLARPFNVYYERRFFRHADALIANTDAMARFWVSRYPQYKDKIAVIYNGFDPDVAPLQDPPLLSRGHRVLFHAGSIYRASFTLELLRALSNLVAAGKIGPGEVQLEFVGEVDRESALRESNAFRALADRNMVKLLNQRVPLEQARRGMAEADFLLVLDRASSNGILQVPAKIFEYIQVGRPILAVTERRSPLEFVLSESGVPHTCLYVGDAPDAQASELLRFLRGPSSPVPPSETYLRKFSSFSQAGELAAILDRLRSP